VPAKITSVGAGPSPSESPSMAQESINLPSLTPASIRDQAIELIVLLVYKGGEILVTLTLK